MGWPARGDRGRGHPFGPAASARGILRPDDLGEVEPAARVLSHAGPGSME